MTPIDIPTRETCAFIASHLRPGAEILEVGCGEGHVARELANSGYRVVGVDSDRAAVEQAQARGVRAMMATWPDFDSPPVDAIAFTRSLHHINPLREALRRSRETVRPMGALFVEDFAFDEADEATVRWFLSVLRSPPAKALLHPLPGAFLTSLLESSDPMAEWRRDHDHELHTAPTMRGAIEEHFNVSETQRVPYLYRYLVPVLAEMPEAVAFIEDVLQEEMRLGRNGEIVLVGLRTVGVG